MHGGQIVAINNLETHVYVNLAVTNTNTITITGITSPLVQNVITNTPGSVILNVDPSLSTLKDYTLFGYNGTSWVEIPRNNLDSGGTSVTLYGNVPGMIIRKQGSLLDKRASVEVSIPVPVSVYGNIMQFLNISTRNFPFTLSTSVDTNSSNIYIQLIFVSQYSTQNTKLSNFIPKYVSGISLWLNALEPGNNTFTPNTGVKMTGWTDKSGQNNHAIAQIATAPMYKSLNGGVGMGMYFNGNTFFNGPLKNTGNYSYIFIVARPDPSNTPTGRLLSLSAPNTDDYSSKAYMGVSANSGSVQPTNRTIVMGVGGNAPHKIKYSTNNCASWQDATSANWTSGVCSSIAYGANIFVAVGYSGSNGVIKYSRDGINWTPANMAAPGSSTNYGFSFNTSTSLGGINTVVFTGNMWICGGLSDSSVPGLAYSYDGMNWFKNTTTLPFTGVGNCITNIATDGNLIILTGTLTPSMSYSYDGINWKSMSIGVTVATQVGTAANTGIHSVAYHPGLSMWFAGGDAGNTSTSAPTASEQTKKIVWSIDGFTWNGTKNQSTLTISVDTFSTAAISITSIFPLYMNNNPYVVMSGSVLNNRSSPIISSTDTSTFGFNLTGSCSGFPMNGSNAVNISAAYCSSDGKIYYGLKTPASSSYYLISSTDIYGSSWTTTTSITYPVFAIVDNASGNPNFIGNIHMNNTTVTNKTIDTSTTAPYIISAWEDSMNTCVSINGTKISSNKVNPAIFNTSSYMIGKNSGTTYNNYIGYIYEIIVYNTLVYAQARFAIEGYLAWKWGIQSFLPSTHPYFSKIPSRYVTTVSWPKFFSDLQPTLWLDAQDPNANESFPPDERTFIKIWYDKSGNKNDLTAPSGSEPIYTTNMIGAGGIQFNRYAYQSMSYLPLPLATDTFSTSATASQFGTEVNTASSWIPGFGGFDMYLSGNSTPAAMDIDSNGFIYMGLTNQGQGGINIIQYDENNNQTRILYCNGNAPAPFFSLARALYVGPKSGCIYMAIEWTATGKNGLIILVPDSLPITSTTNYSSVFNPTFRYTDWNTGTTTNLTGYGAAGLLFDSEENMYINPTAGNGATGPLYFYPYTGVPNFSTVFTSTLKFTQTFVGTQSWVFYSKVDNSISWTQGETGAGRFVLYIDTIAKFIATTSLTTLTVTSMISGTIQLNSRIDAVIGFPPTYIIILSQTSGTPGGAGVYTLSAGIQPDVTSPIKMMSVLVNTQMNSHNTSSSGSTKCTYDGLLNTSVTMDPVASSGIAGMTVSNFAYKSSSYDPVNNSLYVNADINSTDVTTAGSLRIKRINLFTRQVTTVSGVINYTVITNPTNIKTQPILTEKFPLEYGIQTSSGSIIYDTPCISSSQYMPFIIGSKYAYFITNSISGSPFSQLVRVKNFRANPSCMSGPLSLSNSAVSVFIVFSNTNSNKNIMPHRPEWNTPVISLSGTRDFCVFTGGIIGNTLTVTAITSGTIQIGATINTPLGGFIVSVASGSTTTTGGLGVYMVSISQNVAAGTIISASNGIGRVYTGNESASNGPSLGIDTMLPSQISLYANNTTGNVYRNSIVSTVNTTTVSGSTVPGSGILAKFIGAISGTTLTVSSVISGIIQIGAVINITGKPKITAYGASTFGQAGTYSINTSVTFSKAIITASMPTIVPDVLFFSSSQTAINTRINGSATNTTTGTFTPLNVSSIGLGLQPPNISRLQSLLPNYFFDGTICEVIVYNTDLSTDPFKLQILEGYLAWKWGAQGNLSSSHMFKNVSPTEYIPFPANPITSAVVSNILDNKFTVSWSGGDNAVAYTYNLTPAAPNMVINDTGLTDKTVTISGLVAKTAYTLTITANNILGSKSYNVSITTKSYVGSLWAGLASGVGDGVSSDTFTGSAKNAKFYDVMITAFDKYNNMYLCQAGFTAGSSGAGIRVIASNGNVQTIKLSPTTLIPGAGALAERGCMSIDSNGTIWLNANNYIYRLVPSEFPFVMNSSNIITTTWTITQVMGTGASPSTNTLVGLATTVPIHVNTYFFFNNIPSPFITDYTGYVRAVTDNGNGTYNLNINNNYLLTNSSNQGYKWGWNDSVNIYMRCDDGTTLAVYNIKTNSVYTITNPNSSNFSIGHAAVDTYGNFYLLMYTNTQAGSIHKIVTTDVDLNNRNAVTTMFMNFFNNPTAEPFIKYNANTSGVTYSAGAFIPTFYFKYILIDSLNNLYVMYWTDPGYIANYNRPYSVHRYVLA